MLPIPNDAMACALLTTHQVLYNSTHTSDTKQTTRHKTLLQGKKTQDYPKSYNNTTEGSRRPRENKP
eukprot:4435243-Ditylum_brightwellii.AAC.1